MVRESLIFLTTAFVQAILYGLYLVSLMHCFRWLLFEDGGWGLRPLKKVNHLLVAMAVLVFVSSTADVVVSLLITFEGMGLRVPIAHDLCIPIVAMENFVCIMIDAILIYRCWMVYSKSFLAICPPVVFWLSNIICMILFIDYSMIPPGKVATDTNYHSMRALQVFYSCNFATNFYATSAIFYRVRRVARESNNCSSPLHNLSNAIAGTGILYTSTSFALFLASMRMTTNYFAYVLCDSINFTMAGITFNLLLIRVGQLRAQGRECVRASTPSIAESKTGGESNSPPPSSSRLPP